jgi:hypothetical protein
LKSTNRFATKSLTEFESDKVVLKQVLHYVKLEIAHRIFSICGAEGRGRGDQSI